MRPPPHESRFLALLRGCLVLLIVPLAGCTLGAPKQTATAPPPKPAAVQPPAPEPQLSVPQTAVNLPSPQPVNPDAIPTVPATQAPAPAGKTETPAPIRASRRTAAGPPKADPDPEPETPAPAPVVQQPAPIQPIMGDDEQKKIQDEIESRKRQIEETLNRAKKRLSTHDKALVERINSFLAQCAQAEGRGEYSQADALSQRAAILAQELQK